MVFALPLLVVRLDVALVGEPPSVAEWGACSSPDTVAEVAGEGVNAEGVETHPVGQESWELGFPGSKLRAGNPLAEAGRPF